MSNPRVLENAKEISQHSNHEAPISTLHNNNSPTLNDRLHALLANQLDKKTIAPLPKDTQNTPPKEEMPSLTASQIEKKSPNTSLLDARDDNEIEIENNFYKVPKRSAEAWKESDLKKKPTVQAMILPSYHPVEKILRHDKLGFFKHNFPNSSMSELETMASRFY